MSEQKTGSPKPHPIHPRHLVGSKWSSVDANANADADDDADADADTNVEEDIDEARSFCHWEVTSYSKKKGVVVLMATLDTSTRVTIPWRELRDREQWEPGWR